MAIIISMAPPASPTPWLWIYRRADEVCPIEASFDSVAQQYVLVIYKGLPNERWERFTEEASFRTRLQLLEHEMSANRWEQAGAPVVLKMVKNCQ